MKDSIEKLVSSLIPGASVVDVRPLAPDAKTDERDATAKVSGYGLPLRIRVLGSDGTEKWLVFRTPTANDFGHDRRSDRARDMLLAYDSFPGIPDS